MKWLIILLLLIIPISASAQQSSTNFGNGSGGAGSYVPPTTNNLGSVSGSITCNFALGQICAWNEGGNNVAVTATNLPTNQLIYMAATTTAQKTIDLTGGSNIWGPQTTSAGGTVWVNSGFPLNSNGTPSTNPTTTIFTFWSDGTNAWLISNSSQINILQITTNSVKLGGDTAFTTAPRGYMGFSTGALAAISTTTVYGPVLKVDTPGSIDNITLSVVGFTCSGNPTIAVVDCGSTAGSCGSPTTLGSSTPTTTSISTSVTVSSATLTAGDYIGMKTTAGTCSVLNATMGVAYHTT